MTPLTPEELDAVSANNSKRYGTGLPRLNVEGIARRVGRPTLCLGMTKGGDPKHPLYVPAAQPLIPFAPLYAMHRGPR